MATRSVYKTRTGWGDPIHFIVHEEIIQDGGEDTVIIHLVKRVLTATPEFPAHSFYEIRRGSKYTLFQQDMVFTKFDFETIIGMIEAISKTNG